MENASNALMMAGGVLIGILLLSVLVISFNGAADLAKSYDSSIAETSLQTFNNNFEKYTLGEVDIQSIITIAHFAKDYNTKNELTKHDAIYITVECDGKDLDEMTDTELIEFMQANTFYKDDTGKEDATKYQTFICKTIEYNENSNRVNKITFKKVK